LTQDWWAAGHGPLVPGVDGQFPRNRESRTPSGPEGSSGQRSPRCAADSTGSSRAPGGLLPRSARDARHVRSTPCPT